MFSLEKSKQKQTNKQTKNKSENEKEKNVERETESLNLTAIMATIAATALGSKSPPGYIVGGKYRYAPYSDQPKYQATFSAAFSEYYPALSVYLLQLEGRALKRFSNTMLLEKIRKSRARIPRILVESMGRLSNDNGYGNDNARKKSYVWAAITAKNTLN